MDTPATTTAPVVAPAAAKTLEEQLPKSWDDYFPMINKAIMFVILILAVVFVTGVDITKMTGRSRLSAGGGEPVVSSSSVSSVSSFNLKSLSVYGPGGWKVIVGMIVVLVAITGAVFAVLSSSGLDAAWTKELEAKMKEKEKPKKTVSTEPESTECNLASYKMFFGPKEEPAPAQEVAAPATSA